MASPASPPSAAAPGAGDAYPRGWTPWYVVGVLTVGWVIAYMDRQVIGILIESLRADLGLNDTQVSLLQGVAFALFFVLAGLPLGRWVDRGNRKLILVIGVLLWTMATIACGLADSFGELFAARMAVGVGEACLAPASMSLLADLIRPGRRGLAMGIMVTGISVGSAASILIGGLILEAFPDGATLPLIGDTRPWQMVFLAVGLPGLAFAAVLLTIREPTRLEVTGQQALSLFVRYISQNRATFGLVYLAYTANTIIGYTISAWIAVILLRIHGLSPGELGVILASTLLSASLVGNLAAGLFGDWRVARAPLTGRLSVVQALLPLQVVVMIAWDFTDSAAATVAVFAIAGPVMSSMTAASCYPALSQITPNEMRGQAIAVFVLISNIAGVALAPTGVALITDYVLQDPGAIKTAVIWIVTPTAALGAIAAIAATRPFRRTVAGAEWREPGAAVG